MKLSLVLHGHQPPGNFDSVFREGVDRCYGPVLDLLEAHEHVRLSMHLSGSLIEWLDAHAPDRLDQLRRLVERGQIEPVVAGLYEPILALIPPADRHGQLLAHRSLLRRILGRDSDVGWLTERVWEQSLAEALHDGGIRAVPLDERHFLSAGLTLEELTEPFVTDSQGKPLIVVPASEELRMSIPWRSVRGAIGILRRMASEGRQLAVFGDDIEKFGMWPGTYRAVIERGWLQRFFESLDRLSGEIQLVPLGEAVAGDPPRRRVYLPDGSYPEMLEWTLPAARQRDLRRARERLQEADLLEEVDPFLRAGTYFQFMARYPEVNHLHKRVLDVSSRVPAQIRRAADGEGGAPPPALRDLWLAQANCAYWHGWFGGTYLPHLRQYLRASLIRAEGELEAAGRRRQPLRVLDYDADGRDEAIVTGDDLIAVADPGDGGSLIELSDRRHAIDFADTIARRPEAYHPEDGAAPPLDRGRRGWFVDRLLPAGRPPARSREVEDLGDFADGVYEMRATRAGGRVQIALERDGHAGDRRLRIEKRLAIPEHGDEIEAHYRVEALDEGVEARFGVEVNLAVFFPERPSGHCEAGDRRFELARGGAARGRRCLVALDDPAVGVRIEADAEADIDLRPVFTVARSERGLDRTPQALACLLSWPLVLAPGERFERRIRLVVGEPARR